MKKWLISGALAAAVVAAASAWAAIPSGNVIDGCYQKNGGDLRVIDPAAGECRPSEFPLAWNVQGLKGDKGDKGDKGEKGDTGAQGPSEAYRRVGATVSLTSDALSNELVRVELPAGLYAITANGVINKDGASLTACQLLGTSPTDTGAYSTSSEIEWATISLTGVAALNETSAIRVSCLTADGGVQGTAQIMAVKVGALR